MTFKSILPWGMGALMGLMMLGMVHGVVTGESDLAGPALLVFALAHLAVIAFVAVLAIWAARFAPGLRRRLEGLHRPSWRHMGQMVGGAAAAALLAHLVIHGGL